MSLTLARGNADRLVQNLALDSLPIDVHQVAASLGLQLVFENLGRGVSGLLVSISGRAFVCVQKSDHQNRQRFTIAHEIGHFVLRHQFEYGEHVHVDKGNFISQRGARSAAGVDEREIEANQFAVCLLMPPRLLRDEVARFAGVPVLDDQVSELSRMFRVSEQAMTIRLTTMGLL